MKTIDPGHLYELEVLDGPTPEGWSQIRFVKREGDMYPGNIGRWGGTTTQEVLRALIDRAKYVDNQIPHWANEAVICDLRSALYALEARAAERHGRQLKDVRTDIENEPCCPKCGHIQHECKG